MELVLKKNTVSVHPSLKKNTGHLGGGFNDFLFSPRNLGKKISNLTCAYFSNGLVQPPTRFMLMKFFVGLLGSLTQLKLKVVGLFP